MKTTPPLCRKRLSMYVLSRERIYSCHPDDAYSALIVAVVWQWKSALTHIIRLLGGTPKEPPHLGTRRKTTKSIRGQNRREQPRLEGMGNGNVIFWKTCGLEFVKQAVLISSRLRQIGNWRVWSGQPPSRTEQPDATEWTGTFVQSRSGWAALRRDQW
jgi:hypothetical protein